MVRIVSSYIQLPQHYAHPNFIPHQRLFQWQQQQQQAVAANFIPFVTSLDLARPAVQQLA